MPQWERALPQAEIFAATADQESRDQIRAAELAMGHAKRLAEAGEDVVVLIDSLSRLALGYRDPARVKRIFGAGRELGEEGSGSLTVIATVLDSDDKGAEVREALETTENLLLRLDAGLAAKGIVPALEPAHAVGWLAREAGHAVPLGSTVLLTLSGRGDKDAAHVAERLTGEVLE